MTKQNLEHYLNLNYPIEIVEDEDEVVASIPDLPGCVSYGDSLEEAVQNLKATKELWIKGRLESDQEVPEPSHVEDFSGKFVLRIRRVLHKSLDREAQAQGVSLNQYITHLLSERHKTSNLDHMIKTLLLGKEMEDEVSKHYVMEIPAAQSIYVRHCTFRTSAELSQEEGLMGSLSYVPKPPKSIH